jgi:hypothetical protein
MKALILILAAFLVSASAHAQTEYRYENTASLSAAAYAWTIQQPASPSVTARFAGYSLYCSVACTFTVSRNCTAATATSDSSEIRAVSPDAASSTTGLSAFKGSDAASCAAIKTYTLAAGEEKVIEKPSITLSRTASRNVNAAVSIITGFARFYAQWSEQ